MHIPRYWAQARLRHETSPTHGITAQRWGWSDDSAADAQAHAHTRAQQALDQALAAPHGQALPAGFRRVDPLGEYGLLGETPIREEILAHRDRTVLTRNSYGAHCLNVPEVAIADIDALPTTAQTQAGFPVLSLGCTLVLLAVALRVAPAAWIAVLLCALWWVHGLRRWMQARQLAQQAPSLVESALQRVTAFSGQHPDWGLRVYRTPKGLRVIVTHCVLAPDAAEVQALFAALQVDPLYARLCRQQQCFRARVTAKPWRIGLNGPSPQVRRWPSAERHLPQRQAWCQHYDRLAADYAACQFVGQLGAQQPDAAVQSFIDWHDAASQAHAPSLRLA